MNRNLYKLVFDRSRGMTVPTCESAISRGKKGTRARRLGVASAAMVLGAGLLVPPAGAAPPRGSLPVPASNFVSYGVGRVASDIATAGGRAMTIEQSSQRAVFNWKSFDLASGSSVEFKQPSVSSIALNRIFDSKPSEVYGVLKANGQIFLINNNGILFGGGAQVNVGGLVASSLNLSDSLFQAGLESIRTSRNPAFTDDGSAAIAGSAIHVAAGAEIKTANGGSIMLFAPKVTNEGRLDATGGQVVLGGGYTVYMMQSDDYATRGWLVEVDPRYLKDSNGDPVKDTQTLKNVVVASGEVNNRNAPVSAADAAAIRSGIEANDTARADMDADFKAGVDALKAQTTRNGNAYSDSIVSRAAERLGDVISRRGNVSMVGFAVNQTGRVSATTSIKANGSIFLKAQDGISESSPTTRNLAERAGSLVLGAGSRTSVDIERTVDANGKEETQSRGETFNQSRITLTGNKIHLQQSAVVAAAGGDISVEAVKNPDQPIYANPSLPRNDSRVVLEDGATISAAGSSGIEVEGTRNQITAELFGVQLADSPLQRTGVLYRKTVNYDLRRGISVANTSGYEKLVPVTVGERTAAGGTVKIQSEGDIIVASGAGIDVSGGWLDYQQATLLNTYLYSQRKRYDISDAPANIVYSRFENEERTVAAYTEGKNAGSVTLNSAALVLDGIVRGEVRAGEFQRESGVNAPKGGQLIIGDANGGGRTEDPSYRTPKAEIRVAVDAFVPVGGESWLTASLGSRSSTTLLSSDLFAHGIAHFALYSNGAIDQQAPVDVGNGGSVKYLGNSVNVGAAINAPGGSIDISSHKTAYIDGDTSLSVSEPGGDVSVASGVLLNAAGRWTNDLMDGASTPVVKSGGSISLLAMQNLHIGSNSVVDASAGAWLKGDGKVSQGSPGSIVLKSAQGNDLDGKLDFSDSILLAQGFSKGGKLTLAAPNLVIGGVSTANGLALDSDFFGTGGFGSFDLTGIGYSVVKAKTALNLQADGLLLDPDFRNLNGSGSISDATYVAALPPETRRAVDFSLKAVSGVALDSGGLQVETGASITTGTQGKITLSAAHDLWVDGLLSAPAGDIALSLTAGPGSYQNIADLGKRVLWLGGNASLLAQGVVKPESSTAGLRKGEVLAGGAISLDASKLGYVVTEGDSFMDVSGTQAVFDITNQKVRSNVVVPSLTAAGLAGSISVAARHGAFLDGSMQAKAGGIGAAAGSFSLTIDGRPNDTDSLNAPSGYPRVGDYELHVASAGSVLPGNVSHKTGLDAATTLAKGVIAAERLAKAEFADVTLSSQNAIRFDSATNVSPLRSLVLEAPALIADGKTELTSAYIKWSNSRLVSDTATDGGGSASTGAGGLTFSAKLLDLVGDLVLSNVSTANFSADGDIRFQSLFFNENNLLQRTGSLNALANLYFKAQQLYPTTLSTFSVRAPGMAINFSGNGEAAELPLSANGSLTVEAKDIFQGGVLRAPFGNISLKASGQLDILAGSITSVSGAGVTVPYGILQNGEQWVYPNPLGSGAAQVVNSSPEKRVVLEGNVVKAAVGSLIDVSGGGDLLGYEFVPGVGGSRDYLASSNVFAILPGYDAAYSPVDPLYSSGTTLKAGMQITLGAGAGLPAGTYTLLPARYGLLKGAYIVSSLSGYRDLTALQSISLDDGSAIVAGRQGTAKTGILESRTNGYLVEPGSTFLKRSEYRVYSANDILAAANERNSTRYLLPRDSGRLSVAASAALALDGTARMMAGLYGNGGTLEISSPKIAVTDGASYGGDFVTLDIDTLRSIGPATLVLGGQQASGTVDGESVLKVTANEILIDTEGRALNVPELIVAAKEKVTVAEGSTIVAAGFGAAGNPLTLTGDGAVLRVAGELGGRITRVGVVGKTGDLAVQSGVTLKGATIELDATRENNIFNASLGKESSRVNVDGIAVSVGANAIRFGEGDVAGSFNVGNDLLGQLGKASDLVFRSYRDITFAEGYTLSGSRLASVTLDAPLIKGEGGNASVKATDVYLANTANKIPGVAKSGKGTFTVDAGNRVVVVPSEKGMAIGGFAAVELIGKEIVAMGKGNLAVGTADEQSSMSLKTSRLTTTTGADVGLIAKGALDVTQSGWASDSPDGIGGRLKLTGASVTQAGTIDLPAGVVEMRAVTGNVLLAAGSVTRAGGIAMDFAEVTVYADGGGLVLSADKGNVEIAGAFDQQAAAVIDVAAHPGGGNGGALEVNAVNGKLTLGGNLAGQGGRGGVGGSFRVDVKEITALDDVADALAGKGFSDWQDLRVRSGDLALSSGKTLQASYVALSVDGGKLDVAGTVDASGNKGGEVRLFAKDNVTLSSTAKILASASGLGDKAKGGKVTIGSVSGQLDLQSDSRIDVSSAQAEQFASRKPGENADETVSRLAMLAAERARLGGEVILRAERSGVGAGSEVKVLAAKSDFTGAATVAVEAVKKYTATNITATKTYTDDTVTFMSNAEKIRSRLDSAGKAGLVVRPSVEITSSGDLSLGVDWNLYLANRPGGQPGYLTLRAKDNLTFNKSLSDGFESVSSNNLRFGSSWSYALVGGGDMTAADPLRTRPEAKSAAKGDVILAKDVTVRTTTGDIDVAAGRDFKLSTVTSSIYTTGKPLEVVVSRVNEDGTLPVELTTADGWRPTDTAAGWVSKQASYAPGNILAGAFTSGGGDIHIEAGRNASGVADAQMATHWLMRQGESVSNPGNTAWWTNFTQFRQDIGSFGGGDITIRAGGDVTSLSAMLPSNGRVSNSSGQLASNSGGDLIVTAGGNIAGGQYMVMGGDGRLSAGGSLVQAGKSGDALLNPVLLLADGQFSVSARGDANIEMIVNPTVVQQNISNVDGRVFYYTYTSEDTVSVTSVAGDAKLWGDNRLANFFKDKVSTTLSDPSGLQVLPANLSLASLSGDVDVGYSDKTSALVMYPSATGQLDLLAADSVNIGDGTSIRLPDVSPEFIPDVYSSRAQNFNGKAKDAIGVDDTGVSDALGQVHPLHAADQTPVRVIALSGDVTGSDRQNILQVAKPIHVEAGRDVVDFGVTAQNLDSDDISSIIAGRDVRFSVPQGSDNKPLKNNASVVVRGGGLAYIEAGRDIDLATSGGIVTTGNLDNPSLSSSGADIRVLAGAKAVLDTAAFSDKYLVDGAGFLGALGAYMRSLGLAVPIDSAAARIAYVALSENQRAEFAGQVLAAEFVSRYLGSGSLLLGDWTAHANKMGDNPLSPQFATVTSFWSKSLWAELRGAATDASSGGQTPGDYGRGFKALELLGFADVFKHDGDLNLLFSQIKTRRDGDIELFVPGGKLNVGLASVGTLSKDADDLGIISERAGKILVATKADILVNSSRIFSMGGGEILLWTSEGDIDAGKGAKTSVILPDPVRNENNEWEYPAGGAGSGIAAIQGRPGVREANVILAAPAGTVNAGDAGIKSSGNLTIAAVAVIGADNIRAGGALTGVPAAPTVSAPTFSVPSSASAETARSADDMAATAAGNKEKDGRSILTVEVVGVGEESDEERKRRLN